MGSGSGTGFVIIDIATIDGYLFIYLFLASVFGTDDDVTVNTSSTIRENIFGNDAIRTERQLYPRKKNCFVFVWNHG